MPDGTDDCITILAELRSLRERSEERSRDLKMDIAEQTIEFNKKFEVLYDKMKVLEREELINSTWRMASFKTLAFVGAATIWVASFMAWVFNSAWPIIKKTLLS